MELKKILETLIFSAGRALGTSEMMDVLAETGHAIQKSDLEQALNELQAEWEERVGGIRLVRVASGYEFRTRPELAPYLRILFKEKPQRLTLSAVESLAMVAYRQPITRAEIEHIRGVDSGGVLKTLMDRQLIRVAGRKEEPGRPLLYATTTEFLELFGLKDLTDLPSLSEFEEKVRAEMSATPAEPELFLSDLAVTQEELDTFDESDREVMGDLDEKLKSLKSVEKDILESQKPATEEIPNESGNTETP